MLINHGYMKLNPTEICREPHGRNQLFKTARRKRFHITHNIIYPAEQPLTSHNETISYELATFYIFPMKPPYRENSEHVL